MQVFGEQSNKILVSYSETRKRIKNAMKMLADPVARTLGPSGLPILIEREGLNSDHTPQKPIQTKDGVTVAKSIKIKDKVLNTIIQSVIQVADKTGEEAGDGPQPLYSKVLTPTGFVNMGDLEVGMEICGTKGSIQRVEGIFPKGEKEIYRVEFENGGSVECCEDHLWNVVGNNRKRMIKTTKKMIKDFVHINKKGEKRYQYYIPRTFVEFNENIWEMPLSPYFVGVLIGDGSLRNTGSVELSLGLSKEHILEKLQKLAGFKFNVKFIEDKKYFRVKFFGKDIEKMSLRERLEQLGLYNTTSKTKFIPKEYLYSSKESRKELLQGLLDTDGHINKRGRFEYSTVSEKLADDFIELARSLGIVVSKRVHNRSSDSGSYSDTPIYRIQELKGYKEGIKIENIIATGKYTKMQCIKVSNPDHLYITDNYNVTHNTTTAIVLANALYEAGLRFIEIGENPIQIYDEILKLTDQTITSIDQIKIPVTGYEQLKSIATVSANGEESLGEIIATAFDTVGEKGLVTLEQSYESETRIKIVKGFKVTKGFAHNPELFYTQPGICILNDASVLLYDGDVENQEDILPILTKLTSNGTQDKPFIIIARDFRGSALNFLMANKLRKVFDQFTIVKAPQMGHVRTSIMKDISILTGAELVTPDEKNEGKFLREMTLAQLGKAKKIEVRKDETIIHEGAGDKDRVMSRIEELTQQKQFAPSAYDAYIIDERIAALSGCVATVIVGGKTEQEMKERYDRADDAVRATKAAMEDGIVPGGGTVFLSIGQKIGKNTVGEKIMSIVLEAPIRQILDNMGEKPDSIIEDIKRRQAIEQDIAYGYNGRTRKIENLIESRVIDPAKVLKTALKNAVSITNLLLTCGGIVAVEVESKSAIEDNQFEEMM